jgi:hypothetical protein
MPRSAHQQHPLLVLLRVPRAPCLYSACTTHQIRFELQRPCLLWWNRGLPQP